LPLCAYFEGLWNVIGHADSRGAAQDYCWELLMPGERKIVEPMAAGRRRRGCLHSINRCCILSATRVVGRSGFEAQSTRAGSAAVARSGPD